MVANGLTMQRALETVRAFAERRMLGRQPARRYPVLYISRFVSLQIPNK